MFSRSLLLLGGAVMLLVATGGIVAWVTGFTFLREALLDGVPVFFGKSGSQIQVPGRFLGASAIIIPLLAAVGGIWFLWLAFERDQ